MERIDTLKAFVAKGKNTMKSFNDPENIKKYKWYIKESLTTMKGEMLREIDSMLQDKRVTLMRQYNNHNDSLRREITELENERKEIYNFKFNDGAIMKNAKVKSFLAQEFRDLKARLSKKSFKDNKPKSQREVWLTGLSSIKDSLNRFKDENWSEGKHKRDKDGKFSSTGNGGKSAEESSAVSKSDVKSLAKSKNKKEVKKVAKAYWTYFLSGVDDLVDWAGEDEDLKYYAEDGDIDSMAEIMANSKGGRETAIEALDEMEEDELNDISEHINDAAINDFVVSRINEGNIEILINNNGETLGYILRKKGSADKLEEKYGFSNSYEAEQAGIKAAKNFKDSAEHINDSAINDVDISSLCNKYHVDESDMKKIISAIKRNAKGKRVSYRNMPEIGGYLYGTFSNVARDLGYEMTMWDSAEYINDRKIDIKKDGKLIDVVNAGSLDEAVRIYERQHPELRGQIDAYFSDGKVEDGFEEEWSKLMFKMKRLQMNPNTKWSEMEALNEEMNALKKKYGKNN